MKKRMASEKPRLLFLLGPTAVGKSAVAIELALRLGGEVVSADSMQVYRGMDIGTAKPGPSERRGVAHHLLDVVDPDQGFDVAQFRDLTRSAIAEIQARGKRPILVGGSGLYVRALTRGIFEGPGRDEQLRAELEELDPVILRQRLLEIDPVAAAKIDPHDRRRMVRALEFYQATRTPISSQQTQWGSHEPIVPADPCLIGLRHPREVMYRRCDRRVDGMFSKGLVEEVRLLLGRGLAKAPTAAKAIGYAEVIRHLAGELTLPQTVELVKRRTRNLVKRQLTWFRRETDIRWLDLSETDPADSIASRIANMIQ